MYALFLIYMPHSFPLIEHIVVCVEYKKTFRGRGFPPHTRNKLFYAAGNEVLLNIRGQYPKGMILGTHNSMEM